MKNIIETKGLQLWYGDNHVLKGIDTAIPKKSIVSLIGPDDVKIRPYPTNEGMVFFYTQIQYLRGLRALF